MHKRFDGFGRTPLGEDLIAIAHDPARLPVYDYFNRMGMPAVLALVPFVRPLLEGLDESTNRSARQFCGAVVGDLMRDAGSAMVNAKGSARLGGVFSYGAVWSPVTEG
jgi:hypothetical protein